MIDFLKFTGKNFMHGLVELVLFFPAVLLLGRFLLPLSDLWLWISSLPVFCLLGTLARQLLVKRYLYSLLGLILTGFFAFSLFISVFGIAWAGVSCFFLFYRGARLCEAPWEELFPAGLYWGGLGSYLIFYPFYYFAWQLRPFLLLLTGFGWISILISLFLTNLSILKTASLSGSKEPWLSNKLVWYNRGYLLFMLVAIGLAADFNRLEEAVARGVSLAFHLLVQIIAFIASLFTATGAGPLPSPNTNLLFPKAVSSTHAGLPKIILYAVLLLVGILLAFFLAKVILQLLRKCMACISRWLRKIAARQREMEQAGGYQDEKERISIWQEWKRNYVDRVKEWAARRLAREPRWEELQNNIERARFLYRRLVLRSMVNGYRFNPCLTPRETGFDLCRWQAKEAEAADGTHGQIDEVVDLYNKARYSHQNLEDNEIRIGYDLDKQSTRQEEARK